MSTGAYVHGYSPREERRLREQANTLADLLHVQSARPVGSRILEAGCGVGAQTVTLARLNPGAKILAVDINPDSLSRAKAAVRAAGIQNVTFQQADILRDHFRPGEFDHVFLCFVLEHLPAPEEALQSLRRFLRPGGSLTVIEGDHGPTSFHPPCPEAERAIAAQIELQRRAGGDACIGRRLYPLLADCGYRDIAVAPLPVYADASRPDWATGFTLNTFTAMIEGIRPAALAAELLTPDEFDRGVTGLKRCAEAGGTFFYTFFRAVAVSPGPDRT